MRRTVPLVVLLALIPAANAAAHHPGEAQDPGPVIHLLHMGSGSPATFAAAAPEPTATPPRGRGLEQAKPAGPCTEVAKRGMPEGDDHDHQDVTQHRNLRCRIEQVAFLPLKDELAARPDVVLGEMDVKQDVAAVAVIWPEGGLLLFDVSNPAKPKFKSWYRSTQCEGAAIANNCGAFVDLSADGKTAFIAQQSVSFVPSADPDTADPGPLPTTTPGVEVVDISNLEKPARSQTFPVLSQGGVHTTRWHRIPDKGEYVFSIANRLASNRGSGIDIAKFDPESQQLEPASRIEIGETHDTFIQNDPDGKTYLYIAGGYSKGLVVYDVSDPESPKHVASWNLTPECTDDWYSHTVDVVHRNGKRIVTMPAEVFTSSAQTDAEKEMGCGNIAGNGDQPGPLWIIDATDFSKLARETDPAADLKAKSQQSLIATWVNPARRAAGNLTFSPHNQQVVGNRIYLSDYHGGVFVLDAGDAFEGRAVRPRELGFIIPNGERSNEEARPLVGPGSPLPTAVPRTRGRSSIWDMVFYKGYILAADQVGGFYSLHFRDDDPSDFVGDSGPGSAPSSSGPIAAPGTARRRRQLRLVRNRLRGSRMRIELRGTRVRDVRRVSFRLNRRVVRVDVRRPFRVTLRLRNARQRFRIVARVMLGFGQQVTLRRTLVTRAPVSPRRTGP